MATPAALGINAYMDDEDGRVVRGVQIGYLDLDPLHKGGLGRVSECSVPTERERRPARGMREDRELRGTDDPFPD